MRRAVRWLMVVSLFGLLVPVLPVGVVMAVDDVVDGACDDAAFNAALANAQTGGGGTITFDCGGPATVDFESVKTINAPNVVIIDGGGVIELSGQTDYQLFVVDAGATLELRNIALIDGEAGAGGAIENNGTLRITNSTFSGNVSTEGNLGGGAIVNFGFMDASQSTFSSNTAVSGGAIINMGTMGLDRTVLQGNSAAAFAAGLFNIGSATITDSVFEANLNPGGFGGAIGSAEGSVDVSGSTFLLNNALTGGVVYTTGESVVTFTNTTMSGNIGLLGAAVFTNDGVTRLIASTVTENNSAIGSLDNSQGGDIFLRQTIVADQIAGADCAGTITSEDYNLDSDGSCSLGAGNDLPGEDADLGPLADNGGFTMTHLPATDSPAVNAAGAVCPDTDQRGDPRPSGDACDIGAVELQTAATYVLCVNPYTGQVASPASGSCYGNQFELDVPEDYPVLFCISPWTGAVSITQARGCPGNYQPHFMPDDGDLLTCVSQYTGSNRRVADFSECTPYEKPNFIPATL